MTNVPVRAGQKGHTGFAGSETETRTGKQNQKIRDSGPGLKIERSGIGDWNRDE